MEFFSLSSPSSLEVATVFQAVGVKTRSGPSVRP